MKTRLSEITNPLVQRIIFMSLCSETFAFLQNIDDYLGVTLCDHPALPYELGVVTEGSKVNMGDLCVLSMG